MTLVLMNPERNYNIYYDCASTGLKKKGIREDKGEKQKKKSLMDQGFANH